MDKNQIQQIFDSRKNPFIISELEGMLKRFTLTEIEQNVDLKNLVVDLMKQKETREQIRESLNLLPGSDINRLFKDYIENHFDGYLQEFFDKLFEGVTRTVRQTVNKRLDLIEESIADLKNSVLLVSLNPLSYLDAQIGNETIKFLSTQPNYVASIDKIYEHLTLSLLLPIPGDTKANKYLHLITVLRRVEYLKEYTGFMFELTLTEHVNEEDSHAVESDDISTLRLAFRSMDTKKDTKRNSKKASS